ncbi:Metalloendoproteinase [Heracleum sosnowskyi]|uniref:Metalloendoproteinase n=1 Tax=Heracleum sosnowskyi TaxID=360622 RepID=A0AAD8MFT6_9APIA|nr:Metalloendoproteinase [Heracleum sosnowskyi]
MAPTIFQTFLLTVLLIVPEFSNANQSPFQFLEDLKGYHKGDKVEGIHELKQYLNQFGYLNYNHDHSKVQNVQTNSDEKDDHFDDILESAIKTYQLNYHLKPTGVLDPKTISTMMLPRCGVSDIMINGATRMRAGQKKMHHHPKSMHAVSHYQFFSGSPKWPLDKSNLTYIFSANTSANATRAIARAFDKWAASTHFTFTEIQDNSSTSSNVTADIRIGFYSRDHGDGYPFDGPYGVLAHASAPTSGSFHLDADEPWSIGPVPDHIDLETVALHEIGHLLGLQHSSVTDAIMYPSVSDGMAKELHGDDVQGIKDLYSKV